MVRSRWETMKHKQTNNKIEYYYIQSNGSKQNERQLHGMWAAIFTSISEHASQSRIKLMICCRHLVEQQLRAEHQ